MPVAWRESDFSAEPPKSYGRLYKLLWLNKLQFRKRDTQSEKELHCASLDSTMESGGDGHVVVGVSDECGVGC